MTDTEVRAQVMELARRQLRRELAAGDEELADQLDSLQRLSLAVAVEDHFHICLPEDSEAEIRSLPDLVRAICGELERGAGGAA